MLTRGERKNVIVWFEKVKSLTLISTTTTSTTVRMYVHTLRAKDPSTFSVVLHTNDVSDNNNNNN